MGDYIKIPSDIINWSIFSDKDCMYLYLYLMLIKDGNNSVTTSLKKLSNSTGLSISVIRRTLKRLNIDTISTQLIVNKSIVITMCCEEEKNANDTISTQYRHNIDTKSKKPHVSKNHTSSSYIYNIYNKTPQTSSEVVELVNDFIETVKISAGPRAPKQTKKTISNYCLEIDRLTNIDGFSMGYIKDALQHALNDSFWRNNVLSLAGIRRKSKNGLTKFQNIANSYESSKSKKENKSESDQEIIEWVNSL